MNSLILFCIFISSKTLVVSAQSQECVITHPDGNTGFQNFEMEERTPNGTVVWQLVVAHEVKLNPTTSVTLDIEEDLRNQFFLIVPDKAINSTHTLFNLTVKSEFDLFESNTKKKSFYLKFICEPGQGKVTLLVKIKDVNDPPKFIESNNFTFELSEKFPINLPFSKLYKPPIYVTDVDYSTDYGKLEFTVWEDATFSSRSTVIRADADIVDKSQNKFLVNLYLMELLNAKIQKEHRVFLLAKDKSTESLNSSAEVKIVVATDPSQPKFDPKTYSTSVRTKNKSVVGNKGLNVKVSAQIDDGSDIRYEIDQRLSEFPTSFSVDNKGQVQLVDENPLTVGALTSTVVAIRAISVKQPMFSDLCFLTIKIIHLPDFRSNNYSLNIPRDSPVPTALWTANAGPFMTYSLTPPSLYYQINNESGILDTKLVLTDALDETFVVMASRTVDGQTETDTCQVTVRVVDDVQSFTQLKFDHKKYNATIGIKNKKLNGDKTLKFSPGPIKATNKDPTSQIKYEIDKNLSDCPNCFAIHVQTGVVEIININQLVDDQFLATSTLIIRAISTMNALMSDSCSVSIRLVYHPEFVTTQKSSMYIDRNTTLNTVIWTANAGLSQTYSIKGLSEHYVINKTTGVVRVNSTLDKAGKEVVTVIASKDVNGKLEFDEAQIEIHVVDSVQSLTHLRFTDEPYSALVNATHGTLISPVSLKTSGHGTSSARYKIHPEPTECAGCFSIAEATGQLKINDIKPLVRKKVTQISLSVKAISSVDKLYSATSILSIQLVYEPVFTNKDELYVSRNSTVGTVLWTANAGPFMTYSLKGLSRHFDMSKETGALSIKQSLENAVEETITVIASNEIDPTNGTAEAQVIIHVVDNAQSVTRLNFEPQKYSAVVNIQNNVLHGDKLLVTSPSILKAKVYDDSKIRYEIDKTLSDCADCFEIDDKGKVTIVNIETNATKTYLVIRAISTTNPLYSALCSVSIEFVHKPKFVSEKHLVYIPRNLTVDTVLWTAQAGPFMTYSLQNSSTFYDINVTSGAISIKNRLDKAMNQVVNVSAINGKNEAAQTQVSINVVDNVESSTHVQFPHKIYSATIAIKNEKLDGSNVLQMAADFKASTVGSVSAIVYEIDKSRTEFHDSFEMNPASPEIKLINLDPLIEKHLTKTTLTIRATATVNPLYSDICTVSIRIIYKPNFKNNKYSVFVPRNSTEDTVVWTAQAGPFMTYSISDLSSSFDVNKESGAVTTNTLLNTADKQNTVRVTASTKLDGRTVSNYTDLEIHIFDELKGVVARPKFEPKQYSAVIGIKDKKLDGDAILDISPEIKASVSDNHLIHFEIDSALTEFATSFSVIDKTKAQVKIVNIQPLIEKNVTKTTLLIKAVSTIDARSFDVSPVLIQLVYKPKFYSTTHSVVTYRSVTIGTNLWTANAGPFVTYSLKDSSSFYGIGKESGVVSVKTQLTDAGDETLSIVATGALGLGLAETQVTLHILDDAIAQVGVKECSIEENAENTVCLNLSPLDNYRIIEGNSEKFSFSNGQLLSNTRLDYEEKHSYLLTLRSEIPAKTLYVTVSVQDVNEAPILETESQIFAIAPWIQPNNLITTFRANDPDTPNSNNATIIYSISCARNLSRVFNLNRISGQLHWVQKPTENVYFCNVTAKNEATKSPSDSTQIRIFSLQVENIFILKIEDQNQLRRRRRSRSSSSSSSTIDRLLRLLSEVLEMQVVVLLGKPDLQSQSKIEFELFALDGDSVKPYSEVERLLSSKKENLKATLGEHSIEPYKAFQFATDGTKGDELERKSIAVIALSAILGAILALVIVIGFILVRKYRSATLQNSTSHKTLLTLTDDEESSVENLQIKNGQTETETETKTKTKRSDGETNDWVEEVVLKEEINEIVEIRPEIVGNVETIPRIISKDEVAIVEIADHRYSELFDLPLQIEYDEPEIDYKLGERKNVSFKNEEVVIIIDDEGNEEIEELQDVENEETQELRDVENEETEELQDGENEEMEEFQDVENEEMEELRDVENEETEELQDVENEETGELQDVENVKIGELENKDDVPENEELKAEEETVLKIDKLEENENTKLDELKPEEKMEKDEIKPEEKVEKDEIKPEEKVEKDEIKLEEKVEKDELKPEEKMEKDELKPEEKMENDELKPEEKMENDELKPEEKMEKDELTTEENEKIDENLNEEIGDSSSYEDTEF